MKRIISLMLAIFCLISAASISVYADGAKTLTVNVDVSDCQSLVQMGSSSQYVRKSESTETNIVSYIFERSNDWDADKFTIKLDASVEVEDWLVNNTSFTQHEKYNSSGIIQYETYPNCLSITKSNNTLEVILRGTFDPAASNISSITIKPVLVGHDFTATVQATSELLADGTPKGTVSVKPTKTKNSFQLTATANDGFSFDHWSKQGDTDWTSDQNPYTTETMADGTNASYTACFHEWTQPTIVCMDAETNTVLSGLSASATRVKDDTWKLVADGAAGWKFSYWTKSGDDSQEHITSQTLSSETVTAQTTYYAHFTQGYITGIEKVLAYTNGKSGSTAATDAVGFPVGAGVTIDITYATNIKKKWAVTDSRIEVYPGGWNEIKDAIAAGDAVPMTSLEFNGSKNKGLVTIDVESWPADVTKITVLAYTYTVTKERAKYYKELDVSTRTVEKLGLTYLSTPINGKTGGPMLYSTQAYVDEANGGIELYATGVGGVYRLETSGATDMVQMKGMEDLKTTGDGYIYNGVALAMGHESDSSDGLVALVYSVKDMQINGHDTTSHYELRYYDAEKDAWEVIEGSILDPTKVTTESGMKPNNAVVFAANDVWMLNMHWDGQEWLNNSGVAEKFESFRKVSDTVAYAVHQNGTLYRYCEDNPGWTLITLPDGVTAKPSQRVFNVTPDEKLLLLTSNGFVILNREADGSYTSNSQIPAIPNNILSDNWTTTDKTSTVATYRAVIPTKSIALKDAGIGSDNKVYAVVNGTSSTRAYIVRYDGEESGWTLLDTSDVFDIGGAIGIEARPTAITTVETPASGVMVYYGSDGSLYLQTESHTVTFNSNGGSDVESVTGPAWSTITVPQPTKTGCTFAGWYTDEALTALWENPVIPNKDLTVYAKWTTTDDPADPYAKDREMALKQLDEALARMDQGDYSTANWQKVLAEYENGKYRILIAEPKPAGSSKAEIDKAVQNTIYAALNNAIDRMSSVPTMVIKNITVAVSMDANTLSLGYLIKPTLVTVPKYTQASYVITDLIKQTIKEKWNMDLAGKYVYHISEPKANPPYAYMMQGSESDGFYLAHIYYPNQTDVKFADFIAKKLNTTSDTYDYSDWNKGEYLGEFDYNSASGWMYSIADKTTGNQSFPGVGAASWRMRDGEVMRWQFTVWGYGADLNADNSMYGTESITGDIGDKTQLTYKVAEMRELYKEQEGTYSAGDAKLETSEIYRNVLEDILGDPLAKQETLDEAMKNLELVKTELDNKPTLAGIAQAVDGSDMDSALGAYGKLSEEAKEVFDKIYPDAAEKIHAAMAEADKAAASVVDDMITALGNPDKVTLAQEDDVKTARDAYESLTNAQKEYVNKLSDLEKAEARIEALKNPSKPSTKTESPNKPKVEPAKADASKFRDVSSSDWYFDAVQYVLEKGLMNGTSDWTFAPNDATTRGMIVTILARVEGVNTSGNPWYAAGQKWAMQNGISDGTNMPGVITREQLATILFRYAKSKGYDVSKSAALSGFSDADKVSSYAVEAMQWAVAEGLLQGSNGKLDPQGSATRAQVATILMRFMQKFEK